MWLDLRYGLRGLALRPGFALVAVITLALGIGANTAIFSVVDAVVLRPLPYLDPERLFFVWATNPRDGDRERPVTGRELQAWRAQVQSFDKLAGASAQNSVVLTDGPGDPAVLGALYVSANLFSTLGLPPARGRAFTATEDSPEQPPVAILSHDSWQRRFAGDPAIVGRTLTMQGRPTTIVGVLPERGTFLDPAAEVWLPLAAHPTAIAARRVTVVGRLRPTVTASQADAELGTVAHRLEQQFPERNRGVRLRMVSVHDQLTREARPALMLMLAAVALVLLIACANLANLMLARALTRKKEMAVRVALGAGRRQLIRQLLVEAMLLALLGGVAGTLLATWGVDVAMAFNPLPLPAHEKVGVNATVLAFTLMVSLTSGLVFSLAPGWQVLKSFQHAAIREGGRGATSDRRQRRLSSLLVVGEMALAMVLLVSAGLVTRSVVRLLAVEPGFATAQVLTAQIHLPPGGFESRELHIAFYEELERRLKGLPMVSGVGSISHLPLQGLRPNLTHALEIQGRPRPALHAPEIDLRFATSEYFAALDIPLRAGRLLTSRDRDQVVISEVAARRFWPGENPMGQRIRTVSSSSPPTEWQTIVGVVGGVRHLGLEVEPRPEAYFHMNTRAQGFYSLVVRVAGDPLAATASVREALKQAHPGLTVSNLAAMESLVDRSTAQRRFGVVLLVMFAVMAMLLAAVGLYGVMSYAVTRRTQELAVRMALGAQRGDLIWMVVREGMALALAGAAIGLGLTVGLTRLLGSVLFEVSAHDPPTFSVVALLLGLVALVASYLPARRATRAVPMAALRQG